MTNHVNCTCPVCCPDKWTMNMLAQRHLMSSLTQTGIPPTDPKSHALAQILSRLERIEAILEAHVRPVEPDGRKP